MGFAVRARCGGGGLAAAVIEKRRLVTFVSGCEVIL